MRYKTLCTVTISIFVLTASAHAALPQPPCTVSATPAYSAPDVAPTIAIWHGGDLDQSKWRPPSCTGWSPNSHSKLVVAVAGSFRFNGPIAQLLERVGAISTFRTIRYWSATDKAWRPLANDASALTGPDRANRRADFAASDLIKNANLYYWEDDSRSGEIIYRLNVIESAPDRAVIASENITPVRKFFVTLFKPGTLQSTIFIQRLSTGLFGIYILSRTDKGTSALAEGHDASYVNRAAALYRQLAGIKTDQDPPAAK
ncbi:MAG TPA: DUF6675 family protein [Rhizomicrobium sp.]|nr:DUF6675 family protein [Rhizomicrobium sp.]